MKHRIEVTQDDINDTRQGDPQACMVWKAVTRNLQLETEATKRPVKVNVVYDSISLEGWDAAGQWHSINVPINNNVNGKIRKFDRDRDLVKPFGFTLELPDDWREQVQGLKEEAANG